MENLAGGHVPIPSGVIRAFNRELPPFFRGLERLDCPVLRGNVTVETDQPECGPFVVPLNITVCLDVAGRSVGENNAETRVIAADFAGDHPARKIGGAWAIRGVYPRFPDLAAAIEFFPPDRVDLEHAFVPHH